LRFGNKGFIFSLDMIIAIGVVMSVLAVAAFYVTKAGDISAPRLQTSRIGSDVLAVLDHSGALDSLAVGTIETELREILPVNHDMIIEVMCEGIDPIIVETTSIFPSDGFIATGKRFFVTQKSEYCIAGYTIWLK
ncbi:MAG: hypothetical protein ABIJ08_05975, partial [Nanoarchaeota archaeon]